MNEEDKLINVNLQIEQNKEDITIVQGFKLYLFEALYLIQQFHNRYKFIDILLTIFEFIQLMAFPMDKTFNETWGVHWVKTIGNYFRFTQLIYLWQRCTFILIAYILTCIYIIIFISVFIHVVIKSTKFISANIIKILVLIIQLQKILNIPFLRILFSVFSCKNDNLEIYSEIKCKSGVHYFLIILSIILVIFLKILTLILNTTLYEFGTNPDKLISGYSSSTNILLDIIELILVILYQFISHQMALCIITLIISILILIQFLKINPFSNEFTMKLYLSLYSLFCWSCILCIISIFLKDSKFRSGIVLLILGYPFILIIIYIKKLDFSNEKAFSLFFGKTRDGYNNLLEIEYFLKLEESLSEKLKTDKFKCLFLYISNYERKCTDKNCFLKSFLKIPLKTENFANLRIFLLQHAEILYKDAISRNYKNIKLRISFILFLIKKLNKIGRAKNELILINKFETNFECSFLIYKMQKYFKDKEETKIKDNNIEFSQSISYKLKSKEILTFIEKIIKKYISFWNMLLIPEWNNNNKFYKMSHLGEEIKSLNKNLGEHIKSLETWNLLEREITKLYVQYLKEIINNNEEAIKYNNQIIEEHQIKHDFDEINLFNFNYHELSKHEDYKYIIINYSKKNYNTINNISLSSCKLFGYTKEELIGSSSDILFPNLYNNDRKIFMKNKIEEFNQKLLIKNKKINSETWIDDYYAINKSKYLIQFKAKCSLIFTNEDKIFGIWNIISESKNIINDKRQELVYVLTNKDLFIQHFSSNAFKILQLNQNDANNNCNIANYMGILNENCNTKFESKNDEEESNISNRKNKNRRQSKYEKQENTKKYYNYLLKNTIKVIHWKNQDVSENSNIKSLKNINSTKFKNTSINYYINSLGKKSQNNEKTLNNTKTINQGFNFTSIYNFDINQFKYLSETNIKENKEEQKTNENIFYMKVNDIKYNEHKLGYIFIFKPFIKKSKEGKEENIINESKDIIKNFQENANTNLSEISLISFDEEKINSNKKQNILVAYNINIQNKDSFFKNIGNEKENQFTFNLNEMTFRQFKYENKKYNFYNILKEKAIKK